MRLLHLSLFPVLFLGAACAAEVDEGDVGDTEGFTSGALSSGCSLSREQILNGAKTAGRKRAIQRGLGWVDKNVPYSQAKSFEGYRTDCSGFVSMCWELGTSLTTANFIATNSSSKLLGSFDELQPGDAVVHRSGGQGHVILFVGWNDSKKSGACVIEQASTALDMQFRVRTTASLHSSGYKAIRATKLNGETASPGDDDDDIDSAPPDEDAPTADQQACAAKCIGKKSAAAKDYLACSDKCQNQKCDDACFTKSCGKSEQACDDALNACGQQCGIQ